MKATEVKHNIALGIFVLIGVALFMIAIFFVGNNDTLFQRSFLLHTEFRDAGGTQTGDNVWLTGVKIGTISDVDIRNDSTVYISMRIKKKYKPFIKDDVVASIGRDGVMGNRILILKNNGSVNPVSEEQVIASRSGDETTELFESLRESGKNIQNITQSVKSITQDIEEGKGIVGELLTNERWKQQFGKLVTQMEITSRNTAEVSGDLSAITQALKKNKSGVIKTLITDTTFSKIYSESLGNIQVTSQNTARITGDFKAVTDQLKNRNNSVALILADTAFASHLKSSAKLLDEDLEAAQHNFLLRGYFKKKRRAQKK